MRILVTAGPTCEDLDPVRFLTNRSSGRVGYAIAGEAARRGNDVVCVSGPTTLAAPADVEIISVRSASDMLEACLEQFPGCQAVVLTAAVADYTPAQTSPTKIKKSGGDLTLRLVGKASAAAPPPRYLYAESITPYFYGANPLSAQVGQDVIVSVQNPIRVGMDSTPQPDVSLLREEGDEQPHCGCPKAPARS